MLGKLSTHPSNLFSGRAWSSCRLVEARQHREEIRSVEDESRKTPFGDDARESSYRSDHLYALPSSPTSRNPHSSWPLLSNGLRLAGQLFRPQLLHDNDIHDHVFSRKQSMEVLASSMFSHLPSDDILSWQKFLFRAVNAIVLITNWRSGTQFHLVKGSEYNLQGVSNSTVLRDGGTIQSYVQSPISS